MISTMKKNSQMIQVALSFAIAIMLLGVPIDIFAESPGSDPELSVKQLSPTTPNTVAFATPDDPYYTLAEAIAQTESLPLENTLEDALDHHSTFLLWVISPTRLSDRIFSEFGLKLHEKGNPVSLGLITGSTLESARALWQRQPSSNGRYLSVVPREGKIDVIEDDEFSSIPLSKENLLGAIQKASYLTYQGHGSRRMWRMDDVATLTADDIPRLPPLLVNALACQTLKLWGKESIALRFIDQGAVAYAGFVHSPMGHLVGEPKGFPFRHTWPDFPIGHVVKAQNHGLAQGFISWPYYFLLGDPRQASRSEAPYHLMNDHEVGDVRVLEYAEAPAGVIPVYVPNGSEYTFVRIPGVATGWEDDPLYDDPLQMTDIGTGKYLLFTHRGGDFTIELHRSPPWYWPIIRPVVAALDHTTTLYHAEGSVIPNLILAGIMLAVMAVVSIRRRIQVRDALPGALAVGLSLAAFRLGYALVRWEALVQLYESRLRTIDEVFNIGPSFFVSSFLVATCGTLLFLHVRSRWGKGLLLLAMTSPSWEIGVFWIGVNVFINVLAQREYGATLYGYGAAFIPLIVFALESLLIVGILSLWLRLCGVRAGTEEEIEK